MSIDKPQLQRVTFLKSASDIYECPIDAGKEVAFVGRSNSGKSSCLNALVNKKIAKTSKTPGRTLLLNFFNIEENINLVDLPGYGYAKIARNLKNQVQMMLVGYLTRRRCLSGLVVIMDIRHPLTAGDIELIELTNSQNIPLHIVLSKSDKLTNNVKNQTVLKVKKQLKEMYTNADNISVQSFSSTKREGIEVLNEKVQNWLSY